MREVLGKIGVGVGHSKPIELYTERVDLERTCS